MQQFIESNWLTLLSILIGILVAFVFYRLQQKNSISASQERKKHASTELLDVIESYIINKQKLSEQVVDNLIIASERDHSVALRPSCTAISLLQDVALRLQRSRHLDIPQKSEYSIKIEELIREIRDRREPPPLDQLTKEIQQKLSELESLIPEDKREQARKQLASLATLAERQRDISAKRTEGNEFAEFAMPAMAGLTAIIGTALVGSRFFDELPFTSALVSKLLPLVGGALLAAMLVQVLATVLRIRRRLRDEGRESSPKEG